MFSRLKTKIYSSVNDHLRELITGATATFILKIFGAILTLGFNVLLARNLGASDVGIYFLALTIVNIATVTGRAGLDSTLVRFVASKTAEQNWPAVKGVYTNAMGICFGTSLLVTVAVFVTAPFISTIFFSKPALAQPLKILSLAIIPISLALLHGEALKGLKKLFESQLVQGVTVPLFSVLGILLIRNDIEILKVTIVYLIAAVFSCILGWWLWNIRASNIRKLRGKFPLNKVLQSSTPLFWASLLNMVMSSSSTVMLGIWGTETEIGIFNVALRTAMLTSFILVAINSIAAPKFAELFAIQEFTDIQKVAWNSIRLISVFAIPIFVVILIIPEKIMSIFGNEFQEGALVLVIVSIGQLINSVTGPVGFLLMMTGHERIMLKITLLSASASIILGIIVIPIFGGIGAALSTAVSVASLNLLAVYYVRKLLNISVIPFA